MNFKKEKQKQKQKQNAKKKETHLPAPFTIALIVAQKIFKIWYNNLHLWEANQFFITTLGSLVVSHLLHKTYQGYHQITHVFKKLKKLPNR